MECWEGLHGDEEFWAGLLLIHRLGWDQTEEENWAGREFFRGPLGPSVTPYSQSFPREQLGKEEGLWRERRNAGTFALWELAGFFCRQPP